MQKTPDTAWRAIAGPPSELGESPFWHPDERRLYWVDIPARRICRADPQTGTHESWPMPAEPGCMAPALSGGLVIALRDGVYRARDWGGPLTLLVRFTHDPATTRANDGKCDPLGRFWVGTMYEPRDQPRAELLSIDCRSGSPVVARMAGGAIIANGLAWSPDARTVYWADTPRHIVHAWDWEPTANALSRHRVFHQFAPKPDGWQPGQPGYGGRPDGAAVDSAGHYHVALFEGARLCRFSPTGELLAETALPVQCPTMPCFGGDDLKTLYVTSARHRRPAQELADQPDSGRVIAARVAVPGLPVNFFLD